MGRSLLQLSENGHFLTLSLGPSWNYPDMTELLLPHLKFSVCVTSKDAQISACINTRDKSRKITIPMIF